MVFARAANGVAVVVCVSNEKEKPDQAEFHNVQTSKEMVDCFREEETTGIEAELRHIKGIVAVDDPKETKGNDIEDQDQRRDHGVDQAYGREIRIHGEESSPLHIGKSDLSSPFLPRCIVYQG